MATPNQPQRQSSTGSSSSQQQSGAQVLDQDMLGRTFQRLEQVVSGQAPGVNAAYAQKVMESDQALKAVEETLKSQLAIQAQGTQVQQDLTKTQATKAQATIDDEGRVSDETRKALSAIDQMVQTQANMQSVYQRDFQAADNAEQGLDSEGKPSFLAKLGAMFFPDFNAKRKNDAAQGLSSTLQNISQAQTVKSQILTNSAATAALLTEDEIRAGKAQVKAQETLDIWTASNNQFVKVSAIQKNIAGLSQETAKLLNDQFAQAAQIGQLNQGLANTLIMNAQLQEQSKQWNKDQDRVEAFKKAIRNANTLYGTAANPDTLGQLYATGQYAEAEKILGTDNYNLMTRFVLWSNGGPGATQKDWSEKSQTPATTYTPEQKAWQQDRDKFMAVTGHQRQFQRVLNEKIQAMGGPMAVKPEDQKRLEQETLAEVQKQAYTQRFDLAGTAAMEAGEIMIGEEQLRQAGVPESAIQLMMTIAPESLKAGQVRSSGDLNDAAGTMIEKAYELGPAQGDLAVETMAKIFKDQVVNSTMRNYPELFKSEDVSQTKLTVDTSRDGLLGLKSPALGGTGDYTLSFDLTNLLEAKSFAIYRRARKKMLGKQMGAAVSPLGSWIGAGGARDKYMQTLSTLAQTPSK